MLKESFPQKHWQCHFSGIVYSDKGERHHKKTPKEEWNKLLEFLAGLNKDIIIINESPSPIEDSVEGMKIFEKIK